MNKNKIAGLVLAGAIISGASTGATSSIIKPQTKVKNSTKNEKLLVSDQAVDMDTTAVVVNGDNSLILTNEVNGSIISYLSAGEMLHVTAKEGNYYKVKVQETGAIGFISAKNVQLILNETTSNFVPLNDYGHVINVSSEVHLRGKATLNSNIIGFLKNGDNFKIIGKEGQWYKVDSNGHIGFIFEEYVGTTTNETLQPVTEKVKTSTINTEITYHNTDNHSAKKSNISIASKTSENNLDNTKVKATINNNLKVSATPKENINKVPTKKPLGNPDKKTNNNQIISKTGNATIVFVNSKTGIPVANASVTIDGKTFLTNSKGEISLIKLKTGQTTLNIVANNFNATTLTMNVEGNKTLNASVKLTPDNGTALLTFLNADHSRAIANINVLIDGMSYMTNSKGEVLLTNLTPGNHTLTVSAKGFNDTTVKVNINSDGKIIGNVSLYPKVKLPMYNNLSVVIPVNNNLNTKETIKKNIKLESSNNSAKITSKSIIDNTHSIDNNSTINNNEGTKNTSLQTKEKQVINAKNELKETNASNNNKVENNSNNNIVSNNQHVSNDVNKINNNKKKVTNSTITKDSNHIESNNSTVAKDNNHAESNNSTVAKDNNHAESNNTTVAKDNNHAESNNTTVTKDNTHTENNNSTVAKNSTHTKNNNSNISNDSNHIKDNNSNVTRNITNINNNSNTGKVINHIVANNNQPKNINHNTSANSTTINHSNKSAKSNHNKEVSNNQPTAKNSNNKVVNNTSQSKAALQQAIVNYAEQFLGRPYVWGATGPNAFDCSGLTSYVYRHFGYNIGRTTYQQIDDGTPVSLNNLQPGDLLFFGNPSAPDHVVMYIGNHQYIQAPQPGQNVDISSWNWGGIVAARRIV